MNWVDILVVVLLSLVVALLAIYFLIKKAKGQSIAGCDCAAGKGKQIVKAYYAQKARDEKEKDTCPYCHK
jgi:hypothetical protein